MIYALLVVYQLKHFLCDYPLQGSYMLGKFKPGWDWVLPLTAHASVHGLATYLIALCWKPKAAIWVALFDLVVHFTMDRIKASPNMLGRYKALSANEMKNILSYKNTTGLDKFQDQLKSNTYFWFCLGLDQGVHHLTHYVIIWILLR